MHHKSCEFGPFPYIISLLVSNEENKIRVLIERCFLQPTIVYRLLENYSVAKKNIIVNSVLTRYASVLLGTSTRRGTEQAFTAAHTFVVDGKLLTGSVLQLRRRWCGAAATARYHQMWRWNCERRSRCNTPHSLHHWVNAGRPWYAAVGVIATAEKIICDRSVEYIICIIGNFWKTI